VAAFEAKMGHESEKEPDAVVVATRAEVVEILAGAIVALLLERGADPLPNEEPRPWKASGSPISRHIRGLP
jgi:hypothetical protein